VRPVLRAQLRHAPPLKQPLTFRTFLDFYTPLAMTSLLNLLVQPIGSAALSRMPDALESLAVWPVASGLIFMLRSLGYAYNEVVVAMLDEPRAVSNLSRFTALLVASTTVLLLITAATPLAGLWFERVSALTPPLATLAHRGLWIALPIPGLTVLQSWYQGNLVYGRRTRSIASAMAIFLLMTIAILWAGVAWGQVTGLYIGLVAFGTGLLMQNAWLWQRSRMTVQVRYATGAPSVDG
jgi:hypothetical protein